MATETLLSLSTSVKVLLDNIVFSDFVQYFRTTKLVVSLMKKLKSILVKLQTVLQNAQEKRITTYLTFLENWVDRLRYIVLNVESSFQVETQRLQDLIPMFGIELEQVLFESSSLVWYEALKSSVLIDDESCIFGRYNDKRKLKHFLLSSDGDYCKTRVISIVGMGGVGKTTLAKLLYNDREVHDKFELKLWADISSKDFNISRISEPILESIASPTFNPNILLVLDNLSAAQSDIWIYLMDIFNAAEMGSRIIVTTRDERVAISMQYSLYVHYLRPLECEDCWSLIANYAFGLVNYQQDSNLEEIGSKIAKKHGGLPLIAIALGTFLHTNISPNYWNYVLESNIWELRDDKLQAALQLSYLYLSAPLKLCFAYCSTFPKKSILEKKMVVQLWIAEDLVESPTGQKSMEKVGDDYFDELVSRSLIQRRSIGDDEDSFQMHNLVHDLATNSSSQYPIRFDYHRFSYNRGMYNSFNQFDKLYGLYGLHTFLALPIQKPQPFSLLSNRVVHELVPGFKRLCMLSLSNYKSITEVPNSIGNLLYLRYLNLSHTKIEMLPSETCKLYNLKFLLLSGCKRLTKLPEDMGNLVNLCHLDVSDTALREMPIHIAKLENLQYLSDFVVSKHNGGLKVAELGKFPHLHGKLSISQLQNVDDPFEAVHANIKIKEGIDELSLQWDCGSIFSDSQIQIQSVVLENLQPSTNLKRLTIKGYGGIIFPNWLGCFLFTNMVYLRISNCGDCLWLPPLGQLGNLKELIIEGMQSIQTIDAEFYGSDGFPSFQPFPSLETLHFENMQEWEEWNLSGGTPKEFPSLKFLSLSKCPKLRVGNIPDKFPSLTELELRECPQLVQSLPSSNHVFKQPLSPINSLRELTIDAFASPMSLPTVCLPKTLKSLIISNCESLEFLPQEYLHHYTSLEELKISYSCNSMISFTLGTLPVLKSLFIEGCRNLKSILISEDGSQKSLSFLRSIKIWDCNELESFPQGGLHTPNLIYFAVWKCQKLSSLPEAMNTLTDLQEMEIDDLPNLQYFVIDDLPISLRELTVGSVGGIMWNTEPTWQHLTCLSVLRINGNETVNTLMVPLLPASLVTLCIRGLNNTSLDGKWRQHLTSLQNLEIVNAPKLKSLPKKGLPSSLLVLNMTFCPLLKEILRRKRGKEWSKIAHIPAITIDDELIT